MVHEQLRPYGEICAVEYLKIGEMQDGRVKIVIFVPDCRQPLSECCLIKWICEQIDVRQYNPTTDGPLSEASVQLICEKYGPNDSLEDGMRELAIPKHE